MKIPFLKLLNRVDGLTFCMFGFCECRLGFSLFPRYLGSITSTAIKKVGKVCLGSKRGKQSIEGYAWKEDAQASNLGESKLESLGCRYRVTVPPTSVTLD